MPVTIFDWTVILFLMAGVMWIYSFSTGGK